MHGSQIAVAVQEERLTRVKRAPLFAGVPSRAVAYCLDAAGITAADLDLIVTCVLQQIDHPDHDASRNPQLAAARCPRLRITHHLGHAYSALALSGFQESAILVIDGAGSRLEDLTPSEQAAAVWPTGLSANVGEICEAWSLFDASCDRVSLIEKHLGWWLADNAPRDRMRPYGSLGGMYSAVAEQIFGDPLNGPGKLMGLSAFGKPTIPVHEFLDIGSPSLTASLEVTRRFSTAERWPSREQEYADLAASAQAALESAVLELVRRAQRGTGQNSLSYAGGVALNSLANTKIALQGPFQSLFVVPAAEDSGTAIGAACYGVQLVEPSRPRRMMTDACGRGYSSAVISRSLAAVPGISTYRSADLVTEVVDLLLQRKVIGWFQGRSELGPRALGQRSLLCDPRDAIMKDRLNSIIKHREPFRPFAPVILAERASEWFDVPQDAESPFMLHAWPFRPGRAAAVPAVAHIDGTGRVQTIDSVSHPLLYSVIARFDTATGVPILLNTSLNVEGQPLVETPEDAAWFLLETAVDNVVVDSFIVTRAHGFTSLLDLTVSRADRFGASPPGADNALLAAIDGPTLAVRLLDRDDLSRVYTAPSLLRALSRLRALGLIEFS